MKISTIYADLSMYIVALGNLGTSIDFASGSQIGLNIASVLLNIDSSIIDVHISEDDSNIFRRLLLNLCTSDFKNDNEYKMQI